MEKGKLIIVSGPSGVGKNTICDELVKQDSYEYSVSMTTREPRNGEINGIDYFFVTKEEFEERIKNNFFLEYATYNDQYYGTPKDKLFEKINNGINVILAIEVQGAKKIKEMYPDALYIYILPPSLEKLKERLIKRNDTSLEIIEKRINIAKKELEQIDFYNYKIINDDLDKAIKKIKEIIVID